MLLLHAWLFTLATWDRAPRADACVSCGRVCLSQAAQVKAVPTKPYEGQKTGTSGLRKKTKEFMQENYLANWVQSLFNALGSEAKGQSLALGGDGRYFGKEAAQIIIKLAAGNGFKKVVVGKDAIMATPAASALIRERKLYGKGLGASVQSQRCLKWNPYTMHIRLSVPLPQPGSAVSSSSRHRPHSFSAIIWGWPNIGSIEEQLLQVAYGH